MDSFRVWVDSFHLAQYQRTKKWLNTNMTREKMVPLCTMVCKHLGGAQQ